MRIAAVQHDIVWNDRAANFARLAPMIRGAVGAGAELVLLTETFSTGFSVDSDEFAEDEDGPSSTFLREQAAATGAWVCGSCPEVPSSAGEDRRPHNSFVLAGPDGTVHRYRKIHPFTYGGEDKHVRPGGELVTVDIGGLRVSRSSATTCVSPTSSGSAPRRPTCTSCRRTGRRAADCTGRRCCRPGPSRTRRTSSAATAPARAAGCATPATAASSIRSASCWPPPRRASILLADVTADHVLDVRSRFRFMQDRR